MLHPEITLIQFVIELIQLTELIISHFFQFTVYWLLHNAHSSTDIFTETKWFTACFCCMFMQKRMEMCFGTICVLCSCVQFGTYQSTSHTLALSAHVWKVSEVIGCPSSHTVYANPVYALWWNLHCSKISSGLLLNNFTVIYKDQSHGFILLKARLVESKS